MAAMRRRGDIIHLIAEIIKKMFELCPAELVVQVGKPVKKLVMCLSLLGYLTLVQGVVKNIFYLAVEVAR